MTNWAEVRETIRIEEVEEALGIMVDQRGDEDYASCPLPSHGGADLNPSFSINRETLLWNCYSCGGGVLPGLVSTIRNCEWDEAVLWLAQFADADTGTDDELFVRQLEKWMNRGKPRVEYAREQTLPYFSPTRIEHWVEAIEQQDYFQSRGITLETCHHLKLGYAPEYSFRGFTGPAVVIPCFFEGDLVGWQARWLTDDRPKNIPKYVNSSSHDEEQGGFPKRFILYNWDARLPEPLIVVESVMTAIKLFQYGHNAVATFGVSVSDWQIRLLTTHTSGIILAFDNDKAGRTATDKLVAELEPFIPVEVVPPPEGEKADLGDLDAPEVERQLALAQPSFLL